MINNPGISIHKTKPVIDLVYESLTKKPQTSNELVWNTGIKLYKVRYALQDLRKTGKIKRDAHWISRFGYTWKYYPSYYQHYSDMLEEKKRMSNCSCDNPIVRKIASRRCLKCGLLIKRERVGSEEENVL